MTLRDSSHRVFRMVRVEWSIARRGWKRIRHDRDFRRGVDRANRERIPSFTHLSWRKVCQLAHVARKRESHANRRWLAEFTTYLEEILGMENRYSNLVYVVSLGADNPQGWRISWRDIVRERSRYFYPVGKNWPDPPNYIGFRYEGRLQSIHHVEGYDVFDDPQTLFAEARSETWAPHYCLKLGPPMRPLEEVRNGSKIAMSMRVWCMLDLLLTSHTITEALEKTKEREMARAN